MDHHPEPDGEGCTNQSAYPRLDWHLSGPGLGSWVTQWKVFPTLTLAKTEDWAIRLYPDFPGQFVASGVRTLNVLGICRVGILQCDSAILHGPCDLRH